MSPVHSTALIDPAAHIDPTAEIGPYVIIEGPVLIGARTRVMAHAHLSGRTAIGTDNEIHMGAVIGHTPQHLAYKENLESGVQIGNRNVIREYVTIHRAYQPGHDTVIGDGCFLMAAAHVAHDCRLGNRVILANSVLLGGHVQIEDMANLSGNVAVHQFVRIGKLALMAANTRLVKDIPPYMIAEGISEVQGINTVGLRRNGFDPESRRLIKRAYRLLYRSGLNVPQALEQIAEDEDLTASEPVMHFVQFIRNSGRGISRHAATRRPGLANAVPKEDGEPE